MSRYLGTRVPANLREKGQAAIVRTINIEGIDALHATARSRISDWVVAANVPYSLVSEQLQRSLLRCSAAAGNGSGRCGTRGLRVPSVAGTPTGGQTENRLNL